MSLGKRIAMRPLTHRLIVESGLGIVKGDKSKALWGRIIGSSLAVPGESVGNDLSRRLFGNVDNTVCKPFIASSLPKVCSARCIGESH